MSVIPNQLPKLILHDLERCYNASGVYLFEIPKRTFETILVLLVGNGVTLSSNALFGRGKISQPPTSSSESNQSSSSSETCNPPTAYVK
jgi:hypothetical protein